MRVSIGFAAEKGYVRSVFSRRAGCHAVPLDLLRANLRGVRRGDERGRVRAAFADYLVTEPAEVAPVWRDEFGRVVVLHHLLARSFDGALLRRDRLRFGFDDALEHWVMDAPDSMPAGATRQKADVCGELCAAPLSVFRGA